MSKRLARMKHAYRRSIHAAIAIACVFFGGAATAGDLCVLVPHFKDEYWLSVAYGIEARAKEKGLTVHFFEAGGYRALSHQVEQIADAFANLGGTRAVVARSRPQAKGDVLEDGHVFEQSIALKHETDPAVA